MGFAALVYSGTTGAAASNFDLTAISDPDFSIRNGHFIFTEDYKLLGAGLLGATLSRGNFSVPTWNAIGLRNIWPLNTALLPPTNPQFDWDFEYPAPVPLMEEFQMRSSNTGAGEVNTGVIFLGTSDWNNNIPRGRLPIEVRATAAVTLVTGGWSAAAAITLEQSLRGGVYAVYGMETQCTNGQVARMIFPRYKLYNGRKLRPGSYVLQAITNAPNQVLTWSEAGFGLWGGFHTFELPTIEVFGTAGGAQTAELRLYLVYMGESVSLLDQVNAVAM